MENKQKVVLLKQDNDFYNNDIRAMIMAFFPEIKIVEECIDNQKELLLFSFYASYTDNEICLSLVSNENEKEITKSINGDYTDKTSMRNPFKLLCYHILSEYTNRLLPWGSLTGIRPTKIAMSKVEDGTKKEDIIKHYIEVYETTKAKAKIATDVAIYEESLIRDIDFANSYCLYIGIPFCPTRCVYCSFTSYSIKQYRSRVSEYLEALDKELAAVSDMYKDKKLVAIYIGGGTPTSISSNDLRTLLESVASNFDLSNVREYTVEAGRPDSLLVEVEDGINQKLRVLKEFGVTRISINPQTMNSKTLEIIGRAHSVEQVKEAFKQARAEGFDNINMDLIAGLPKEDCSHMANTLEQIKDLDPDSITVHSLAVKRAAQLRHESFDNTGNDTDLMLDMVYNVASELGQIPYYLYRQKNISGNLENVGYSKPDKASLYNILIMEEKIDIIAAGAGAATKLIIRDAERPRVDRIENVKSVEDYILRVDEMINRKSTQITP